MKQLRWFKRAEQRNEVSEPKIGEWRDGAEGKQLEAVGEEDRAVPGLHLDRGFWASEIQSPTSKMSTFRQPALSYTTC